MLNFRKTKKMEYDDKTGKYGTKDAGKDQQNYEVKVNDFLKYCRDFEQLLRKKKEYCELKTIGDVRKCFNDSFKGYYKGSKKFGIFSRTTRVLNEMDKKLKKCEKIELSDNNAEEKLREAFEYTCKRDDKKEKGSRAAVDDRFVHESFNVRILGILHNVVFQVKKAKTQSKFFEIKYKTLIIHGNEGLEGFCKKKDNYYYRKLFAKCTELVLDKVTSVDIKKAFLHFNFTTVKASDVTSIGEHAFGGCEALTAIDLSKITTIKKCAFFGCTALTTIDLSNVTSIGTWAFNSCEALKTIDLSNVTSIGGRAFGACKALTTINLQSATSIGEYAFCTCTALKEINLPNVKSIGEHAFWNCINLTTVTLGQEKVEIGENAFCPTDKELTINVRNEAVGKAILKNCEKYKDKLKVLCNGQEIRLEDQKK